MTREDAIRELKIFSGTTKTRLSANFWKALEMAIKALEQEPCEDAVSRKAVVEYIKASDAELGHDSENEMVVGDILTMPSVKPVACIATVKFSKEDMQKLIDEKMKDIVVERKKGKWIFHEKSISTGFKDLRECSCCRCYFRWEMPRNSYCPNCGAEMEGKE